MDPQKSDSFPLSKALVEKEKKELDEVLGIIGGFGRYQKLILALLSFVAFVMPFQTYSVLFTANNPDHHCGIPQKAIDQSNCSLHDLKYTFIPHKVDGENHKFAKCEIYDIDEYEDLCSYANYTGIYKTETCDQWEYDTSELHYQRSIVNEWDLVCSRTSLVATSSAVYMAARPLAVAFLGPLIDRFGRRKMILATGFGYLVGVVLTALAPSYTAYIAARFIVSGFGMIRGTAEFLLLVELVVPSKRVLVCVLNAIAWGAGIASFPLLAYFFHSWRNLHIAMAIPDIIPYIVYIFFLPESPRWLFVRGYKKEAIQSLRKIADINRKDYPEDIEIISKDEKTPLLTSLVNILKRPKLRGVSFILWYVWFTSAFVYYGISLNTSNIGGNPFINCVISGAVEVVGYSITLYLFERFGRVKPIAVFLVGSGLAMCATSPFPEGHVGVIVFAMIGKFCIATAFGMVWFYSPEVFPTSARSVAVSACSLWARISSILASYVFLLSSVHRALPLLLLGGSTIIAGTLSIMLPETKNMPLKQTLDECEEYMKSQDKQSSCMPRKKNQQLDEIDEITVAKVDVV